MIRIASKMWLYFGFVGNLSILVWLISGVLLARYARHERRTRGWWAALIVALVAFGLARANSDSVSQILPDQRAELEDASERSERERAGLNPHKSVREDMKAAVHIADDEDEEDKDKGDGYGGYDEETGKTNMYEAAAAGKAAPEDGAGKETQPAEGAETAAAGGEGDGPPREPGEIEDPEAPADPFAYRTGGKVARDGDKKEDAGDLGKAANVKQSQDAQNVKMLRQRDLHRAQHIDQLNLCASRFMLWLAVCLVFADYMGRFIRRLIRISRCRCLHGLSTRYVPRLSGSWCAAPRPAWSWSTSSVRSGRARPSYISVRTIRGTPPRAAGPRTGIIPTSPGAGRSARKCAARNRGPERRCRG